MKEYRVNAVVVTHDRLELLKQSVECLLRQTYVLNRIIIVDNASTDGTKEYLKKLRSNERIEVLRLKRNRGGAGGFFYGIRRAYEIGCDFIWTMDDDTLAEKDALKALIKALPVVKEKRIGFLSGNVLYKDGTPCRMNVSRTVPCWNEFIKKGIIEISHASFVSLLIPHSVVAEAGLPIREYFIWGDDAEYTTRILRKGYSGYQVGSSTVLHCMDENVGVDIFHTPKERIGRYFYFYRNVTITDRMRGLRAFLPRLAYHGFIAAKILFGKTDHRLRKAAVVLWGTVCGMFKRVRIVYVGESSSGNAGGEE